MRKDALFGFIESHHGSDPWGSTLDAGTGPHSLGWVSSLASEAWTAITAEPRTATALEESFQGVKRPADRILLCSWTDPALLDGEAFDVVLADYLVGAIDRVTPYYQESLFARLRPHVRNRIYVIGQEPFPRFDNTVGGDLILRIIQARDACFTLASERPYREYPMQWSLRHLEANGYEVEAQKSFANIYRVRFVDTQIATARRLLRYIRSKPLVASLEAHLNALHEEARASAAFEDGVRFGSDYVIAARISA